MRKLQLFYASILTIKCVTMIFDQFVKCIILICTRYILICICTNIKVFHMWFLYIVFFSMVLRMNVCFLSVKGVTLII